MHMNRTIWLHVVLGTTMMLLLGIVYSYSMFRLEIRDTYDLNALESGLPYTFSLFFYALFMAIGGRWFQRTATIHVAITGTILIAGGFLLASVWASLIGLVVSYGVLIGSGVGLLYGLPLRIVSQLNHARRGLLMGITLMGFGLSPLLFAPIVQQLLSHLGLAGTFRVLALVYALVLTLLFVPLVRQDHADKDTKKMSFAMLRSPRFLLVYALFFLGTLMGLTVIGFTGDFGVDAVGLDALEVSFFLGLFAVLNGVGRPLFGYLNDTFGFVRSAALTFILLLLASGLLLLLPISTGLYLIAFSLVYVVFGGWLSLAPGATIRLFGATNYSQNYGLMFTAYGLGALLGNSFGGLLVDAFDYMALFWMMIGLSLLGLLILRLGRGPLTTTESTT
jgi:predicted MFS family arabinose efflux permease